MSAGSVGKFEDGCTVAIMTSVFSFNDLSVGCSIKVNDSFCCTSSDQFSCLIEIEGILRREDRRGLTEG